MSTDIAKEIRSLYRGSSFSRGEAFDRWLADTEAAERLAERDRIIQLLESIRVGDNWIGRDYAISLIRGEE